MILLLILNYIYFQSIIIILASYLLSNGFLVTRSDSGWVASCSLFVLLILFRRRNLLLSFRLDCSPSWYSVDEFYGRKVILSVNCQLVSKYIFGWYEEGRSLSFKRIVSGFTEGTFDGRRRRGQKTSFLMGSRFGWRQRSGERERERERETRRGSSSLLTVRLPLSFRTSVSPSDSHIWLPFPHIFIFSRIFCFRSGIPLSLRFDSSTFSSMILPPPFFSKIHIFLSLKRWHVKRGNLYLEDWSERRDI